MKRAVPALPGCRAPLAVAAALACPPSALPGSPPRCCLCSLGLACTGPLDSSPRSVSPPSLCPSVQCSSCPCSPHAGPLAPTPGLPAVLWVGCPFFPGHSWVPCQGRGSLYSQHNWLFRWKNIGFLAGPPGGRDPGKQTHLLFAFPFGAVQAVQSLEHQPWAAASLPQPLQLAAGPSHLLA